MFILILLLSTITVAQLSLKPPLLVSPQPKGSAAIVGFPFVLRFEVEVAADDGGNGPLISYKVGTAPRQFKSCSAVQVFQEDKRYVHLDIDFQTKGEAIVSFPDQCIRGVIRQSNGLFFTSVAQNYSFTVSDASTDFVGPEPLEPGELWVPSQAIGDWSRPNHWYDKMRRSISLYYSEKIFESGLGPGVSIVEVATGKSIPFLQQLQNYKLDLLFDEQQFAYGQAYELFIPQSTFQDAAGNYLSQETKYKFPVSARLKSTYPINSNADGKIVPASVISGELLVIRFHDLISVTSSSIIEFCPLKEEVFSCEHAIAIELKESKGVYVLREHFSTSSGYGIVVPTTVLLPGTVYSVRLLGGALANFQGFDPSVNLYPQSFVFEVKAITENTFAAPTIIHTIPSVPAATDSIMLMWNAPVVASMKQSNRMQVYYRNGGKIFYNFTFPYVRAAPSDFVSIVDVKRYQEGLMQIEIPNNAFTCDLGRVMFSEKQKLEVARLYRSASPFPTDYAPSCTPLALLFKHAPQLSEAGYLLVERLDKPDGKPLEIVKNVTTGFVVTGLGVSAYVGLEPNTSYRASWRSVVMYVADNTHTFTTYETLQPPTLVSYEPRGSVDLADLQSIKLHFSEKVIVADAGNVTVCNTDDCAVELFQGIVGGCDRSNPPCWYAETDTTFKFIGALRVAQNLHIKTLETKFITPLGRRAVAPIVGWDFGLYTIPEKNATIPKPTVVSATPITGASRVLSFLYDRPVFHTKPMSYVRYDGTVKSTAPVLLQNESLPHEQQQMLLATTSSGIMVVTLIFDQVVQAADSSRKMHVVQKNLMPFAEEVTPIVVNVSDFLWYGNVVAVELNLADLPADTANFGVKLEEGIVKSASHDVPLAGDASVPVVTYRETPASGPEIVTNIAAASNKFQYFGQTNPESQPPVIVWHTFFDALCLPVFFEGELKIKFSERVVAAPGPVLRLSTGHVGRLEAAQGGTEIAIPMHWDFRELGASKLQGYEYALKNHVIDIMLSNVIEDQRNNLCPETKLASAPLCNVNAARALTDASTNAYYEIITPPIRSARWLVVEQPEGTVEDLDEVSKHVSFALMSDHAIPSFDMVPPYIGATPHKFTPQSFLTLRFSEVIQVAQGGTIDIIGPTADKTACTVPHDKAFTVSKYLMIRCLDMADDPEDANWFVTGQYGVKFNEGVILNRGFMSTNVVDTGQVFEIDEANPSPTILVAADETITADGVMKVYWSENVTLNPAIISGSYTGNPIMNSPTQGHQWTEGTTVDSFGPFGEMKFTVQNVGGDFLQSEWTFTSPEDYLQGIGQLYTVVTPVTTTQCENKEVPKESYYAPVNTSIGAEPLPSECTSEMSSAGRCELKSICVDETSNSYSYELRHQLLGPAAQNSIQVLAGITSSPPPSGSPPFLLDTLPSAEHSDIVVTLIFDEVMQATFDLELQVVLAADGTPALLGDGVTRTPSVSAHDSDRVQLFGRALRLQSHRSLGYYPGQDLVLSINKGQLRNGAGVAFDGRTSNAALLALETSAWGAKASDTNLMAWRSGSLSRTPPYVLSVRMPTTRSSPIILYASEAVFLADPKSVSVCLDSACHESWTVHQGKVRVEQDLDKRMVVHIFPSGYWPAGAVISLDSLHGFVDISGNGLIDILDFRASRTGESAVMSSDDVPPEYQILRMGRSTIPRDAADANAKASPDDVVMLVFSEPVQAVSGTEISLYHTCPTSMEDTQPYYSYKTDDIFIHEQKVLLQDAPRFLIAEQFYLHIEQGAFRDLAGLNSPEIICGSYTWGVDTKHRTNPPDVVGLDLQQFRGLVGNEITVYFSERLDETLIVFYFWNAGLGLQPSSDKTIAYYQNIDFTVHNNRITLKYKGDAPDHPTTSGVHQYMLGGLRTRAGLSWTALIAGDLKQRPDAENFPPLSASLMYPNPSERNLPLTMCVLLTFSESVRAAPEQDGLEYERPMFGHEYALESHDHPASVFINDQDAILCLEKESIPVGTASTKIHLDYNMKYFETLHGSKRIVSNHLDWQKETFYVDQDTRPAAFSQISKIDWAGGVSVPSSLILLEFSETVQSASGAYVSWRAISSSGSGTTTHIPLSSAVFHDALVYIPPNADHTPGTRYELSWLDRTFQDQLGFPLPALPLFDMQMRPVDLSRPYALAHDPIGKRSGSQSDQIQYVSTSHLLRFLWSECVTCDFKDLRVDNGDSMLPLKAIKTASYETDHFLSVIDPGRRFEGDGNIEWQDGMCYDKQYHDLIKKDYSFTLSQIVSDAFPDIGVHKLVGGGFLVTENLLVRMGGSTEVPHQARDIPGATTQYCSNVPYTAEFEDQILPSTKFTIPANFTKDSPDVPQPFAHRGLAFVRGMFYLLGSPCGGNGTTEYMQSEDLVHWTPLVAQSLPRKVDGECDGDGDPTQCPWRVGTAFPPPHLYHHQLVVVDGWRMVLVGGTVESVWHTINIGGRDWLEVNDAPPYGSREGIRVMAASDSYLYLLGGQVDVAGVIHQLSDLWQSKDYGRTWYMVNGLAMGFGAQYQGLGGFVGNSNGLGYVIGGRALGGGAREHINVLNQDEPDQIPPTILYWTTGQDMSTGSILRPGGSITFYFSELVQSGTANLKITEQMYGMGGVPTTPEMDISFRFKYKLHRYGIDLNYISVDKSMTPTAVLRVVIPDGAFIDLDDNPNKKLDFEWVIGEDSTAPRFQQALSYPKIGSTVTAIPYLALHFDDDVNVKPGTNDFKLIHHGESFPLRIENVLSNRIVLGHADPDSLPSGKYELQMPFERIQDFMGNTMAPVTDTLSFTLENVIRDATTSMDTIAPTVVAGPTGEVPGLFSFIFYWSEKVAFTSEASDAKMTITQQVDGRTSPAVFEHDVKSSFVIEAGSGRKTMRWSTPGLRYDAGDQVWAQDAQVEMTIPGGVFTDAFENVLSSPLKFSFRMKRDVDGPEPLTTYPIRGTYVSKSHPIWIRFDEVVQLGRGETLTENVVVKMQQKPMKTEYKYNTNPHLFEVSGRDLIIRPDPMIGAGEYPEMTIPSNGILDRVGNSMPYPIVLTWTTYFSIKFAKYGTLSTKRHTAEAGFADSRIVVFGGGSDDNEILDSLEEIDTYSPMNCAAGPAPWSYCKKCGDTKYADLIAWQPQRRGGEACSGLDPHYTLQVNEKIGVVTGTCECAPCIHIPYGIENYTQKWPPTNITRVCPIGLPDGNYTCTPSPLYGSRYPFFNGTVACEGEECVINFPDTAEYKVNATPLIMQHDTVTSVPDDRVCAEGHWLQNGGGADGREFHCHHGVLLHQPNCTPTYCDGSPTLLGEILFTDCAKLNNSRYGDQCAVKCPPGSHLVDENKQWLNVSEGNVSCGKGGRYRGGVECKVRTCPEQPAPKGEILDHNCTNLLAGSECTVRCERGWITKNNGMSSTKGIYKCDLHARLTGSIDCNQMVHCPISELLDAPGALPLDCKTLTPYLENCEHQCKEGFILRTGSLSQQCAVDDPKSEWGPWIPKWRWWGAFRTGPECVETSCGQAPMIAYGDASDCDGLGHNQKCDNRNIKCMLNHTPDGSLICQSGAYIQLPVCRDINIKPEYKTAVTMIIDILAPDYRAASRFAQELVNTTKDKTGLSHVSVPMVYSRGILTKSTKLTDHLEGISPRRLEFLRALSRWEWSQYTMTLFALVPEIEEGDAITYVKSQLQSVVKYYEEREETLKQNLASDETSIFPHFNVFGDSNSYFLVQEVSAFVAPTFEGEVVEVTEEKIEELPSPEWWQIGGAIGMAAGFIVLVQIAVRFSREVISRTVTRNDETDESIPKRDVYGRNVFVKSTWVVKDEAEVSNPTRK